MLDFCYYLIEMTRRRYRRSRKTTPIKEVLFLFTLVFLFFVFGQIDFSTNGQSVILFFLSLGLLLGAGIYSFLLLRQHTIDRALQAVDLADVDVMKGEEFERYVAALLKHQSYRVTKTPPSSDYGVDIIARRGGVSIAVQVKRYSKALDQKAIREAVAGKTVRKYRCTEAMVVTNSTFTKAARFLANESGCILVDREVLGEWILDFRKE